MNDDPPTFEELLTDPLEQFDTRSELLPMILQSLVGQPDTAAVMRSIEEYRNAPPSTATTAHMINEADR